MRNITLLAALALPLAALAAPSADRGPAAPDEAARRAHVEKRMRMARTLGLAEALDLGEAEALKMRETLAAFDARSSPLRAQLRESKELVRRAARGDAAAQKGLDEALRKLRDTATQLRALHDEMFQALTRDLSPQRKARAALFLERFHQRMGAFGREWKMRHGAGRGMGHGAGPGPQMGMEMGSGAGPRWGMASPGGDGPDLEFLPDDEVP
ncbi:MAG: hypothetical protein HZB56_01630 [Deltaproteobacteria bacterium]|nr:hypothetical protein [Deltaproteobacteria bacterium]